MQSRLEDQVGRILGERYRLRGLIGTGAAGYVFLADDDRLGRRVAVKLLHTGLIGDEAFIRRFRAEARGAAALSHPNIVGVLDWGEDDDGPYLVMDHLGGGSLRDLLDAGHRLSVSQTVAVGTEAARGLAYAHRRGLVHRDVKPANLLFYEDGRLGIADFGLARALAEAAWTEPMGGLVGTVRYSSPEAAQGRSVDGRADMYALGLVLIEAVSGTVPFRADTTLASLMARVASAPEIPSSAGALRAILVDLTRIDPEDRPDAADLVRALESLGAELARPEPLPLVRVRLDTDPTAALGALDLGAADPNPVPGSVIPATLPGVFDVDEVLPAVSHRERRRRRWWPWLVGLAMVVLAAGGYFGFRVLTAVPSFHVPNLYGLSPAKARTKLLAGHFHLKLAGDSYSAKVPDGEVVSQSAKAGSLSPQSSTIGVKLSKGPQPVPVPPVTNESKLAASARLKAAGLVPTFTNAYSETVKSGLVIKYAPNTGTHLPGTKVAVVISKGPMPRVVPTFASNTPYATAAAALTAEQLNSKKVSAYSNTVDSGDVIGSDPGPGQMTPRGSTVTLTVSLGPHYVSVPNVYGESSSQAVAQLTGAGFQAHVYGPGGTVQLTSPSPGATVLYGSTVNVIIL
ncbi:MAG: protein kinase domain-containing protein [Acidimicrobiales bacterium]